MHCARDFQHSKGDECRSDDELTTATIALPVEPVRVSLPEKAGTIDPFVVLPDPYCAVLDDWEKYVRLGSGEWPCSLAACTPAVHVVKVADVSRRSVIESKSCGLELGGAGVDFLLLPRPVHWPSCDNCGAPNRRRCATCGISLCIRCQRRGVRCMCGSAPGPLPRSCHAIRASDVPRDPATGLAVVSGFFYVKHKAHKDRLITDKRCLNEPEVPLRGASFLFTTTRDVPATQFLGRWKQCRHSTITFKNPCRNSY